MSTFVISKTIPLPVTSIINLHCGMCVQFMPDYNEFYSNYSGWSSVIIYLYDPFYKNASSYAV